MKGAIVVVLMTLLTGCSSAGALYWGWHCEGDPRSGEWECEQRLLRDGQPVDATLVAPHQMPPPPALTELGPPPANPNPPPRPGLQAAPADPGLVPPLAVRPAHQSLPPRPDWRTKLPRLDGGSDQPAHRPEPVTRRKIGRDGPAPRPDTYRAAAPAASIQPVVIAPTARQSVAISAAPPSDGYTLQLAALDSERHVAKYLAEHQLPGEQLQRYRVASQEREFYVLTIGQFHTVREAARAARTLQRRYPGISYWVRPLKSLRPVTGR